MVRKLNKKPEGYFKTAHSNNFLWFELSYKETPYAYAAIEPMGVFASVHTEMVRWNHSIAKIMQIDWQEVKFICKQLGVKEMVASNDDVNDKRWPKFIRLFGFDKPSPILVSRQEI